MQTSHPTRKGMLDPVSHKNLGGGRRKHSTHTRIVQLASGMLAVHVY